MIIVFLDYLTRKGTKVVSKEQEQRRESYLVSTLSGVVTKSEEI